MALQKLPAGDKKDGSSRISVIRHPVRPSIPQGERLWSHPITLIRDEPKRFRRAMNYMVYFGPRTEQARFARSAIDESNGT